MRQYIILFTATCTEADYEESKVKAPAWCKMSYANGALRAEGATFLGNLGELEALTATFPDHQFYIKGVKKDEEEKEKEKNR